MQSIIAGDEKGKCFVCGRKCKTDVHHIFGGHANRKLSEMDGLKVNLCRSCHEKAHSDYKTNVALKQVGEECWLLAYRKKIDDFIDRYGKNYLY